tara:strand:- start:131 stop:817 length:687 start_codon:yes stop_codon:yes gene_type:complete
MRFYSYVKHLNDPNHQVGGVPLSLGDKVYMDINDVTGEISVSLEDTGVSLQRQADGTVKIFKDGSAQEWYLVYTPGYMKWDGSTAVFAGPEVENPTAEGYWPYWPYILEGKRAGDLRDSGGALKHGSTWTGGSTYLGTTELANKGFVPWYILYGDHRGSLRWVVADSSNVNKWKMDMGAQMGRDSAEMGYQHWFVAGGVAAAEAYPTTDYTDSYSIRYSNGDIAQEQG